MKNAIFYFSGTGNSLYTAKQVCSKLDDCELINIAKQIQNGYEIDEVDSIGFIIPVYVFGAPLIVEEFIEKIKITKYRYLYILFVHGGAPYSAVFSLKKKLTLAGYRVDAGYELLSADNYIEGNNPPDNEKSIELVKLLNEEVDRIIDKIKNKIKGFPRTAIWKKLFGSLVQPSFNKIASKASKKFRVTDKCNGCSTCVKLCPREIILLNDKKKPEWIGNNCEMCFACINLCPKMAIEIGKKTIGRNRYKNPEISIKELMIR